MKPSWDDPECPSWAQWLAMDRWGRWCWYAMKPELIKNMCWVQVAWTKDPKVAEIKGWENTLEQRPEKR